VFLKDPSQQSMLCYFKMLAFVLSPFLRVNPEPFDRGRWSSTDTKPVEMTDEANHRANSDEVYALLGLGIDFF